MKNPRELNSYGGALISDLTCPYKAMLREVRRACGRARAGGHLVGLGRRYIPARPPRSVENQDAARARYLSLSPDGRPFPRLSGHRLHWRRRNSRGNYNKFFMRRACIITASVAFEFEYCCLNC